MYLALVNLASDRKAAAAALAAVYKWGILVCLSSTHAPSRVNVRATPQDVQHRA